MSAARKFGIARILDFFRSSDLELVDIVYEAAGRIVTRRRAEEAKVPAIKRTRRPRAAGAPSQSASATASSTQEA